LFSQLFDNLSPRGWFVAKCFAANAPFKFFNQRPWKAVGINGKCLVMPYSRLFPVTSSGVFARRYGCSSAIAAFRVWRRSKMLEGFDVGQAQPLKIRHTQCSKTGDVSQGIATAVPVIRCVRQFTNAYAVEHDPDHALKRTLAHDSFPVSGVRCRAPCQPMERTTIMIVA